jgi:uncharacterized small protein (DUF1192 family)
MSERKGQDRNELSPAKKPLTREVTEKDAGAVELGVEELEERIAPMKAL